MFDIFVLPFCAGVVALLAVSLMKYIRWINSFSKRQQITIRRNILSINILPAIWEMFRECLLHWRITQRNLLLGYMHRSLAFGWFLLIVVGFVQALMACPGGHPFYAAIFFNYFEPRSERIVEFAHSQQIATLMDVLLLYVLSGLFLAMLKKVWSKPLGMKRTTKHNLTDRIAKFSLWCIFPLRLLAEGATSSIYGNGGFLVRWVGTVIAAIGLDSAEIEYLLWVLYSLALGTFFTLMPFTRYMHIFTEVFLIYFRKNGVIEGNKPSGYTKFELSACSRCGICIDHCPVNRELGISNTQGVYLLQTIRNKDLWHRAEQIAANCMVCDRCQVECPVGIDLATIRRQVRSEAHTAIDKPVGYNYLERVHPFNAIGRIAYFGGCMSHLTPGITSAMEQIFKAAGQPYWYMDKEQSICCGRPLLQQGLVKQAEVLRRKNRDMITRSGATMLVTSCPICYQSLVKEYQLSIKVMHHTEYIDMLLRSGKLKVKAGSERIAYHDPCELGRGCGIYQAPRDVLGSVGTLLKTKEERANSLCCGYNLGNISISTDQQQLVRDAALGNLLAPNPDTIATACPMCKRSFARANAIPVKDIAEIVADSLVQD